jgi:hypothetical protein
MYQQLVRNLLSGSLSVLIRLWVLIRPVLGSDRQPMGADPPRIGTVALRSVHRRWGSEGQGADSSLDSGWPFH